ncbi:hypothetical protein E4U32_005456 [Claviceps aff. humidiphila group G2b]|nr:hypothetical protein E4U32_005456 [Claviceps aff. humidiphila group G2b]
MKAFIFATSLLASGSSPGASALGISLLWSTAAFAAKAVLGAMNLATALTAGLISEIGAMMPIKCQGIYFT